MAPKARAAKEKSQCSSSETSSKLTASDVLPQWPHLQNLPGVDDLAIQEVLPAQIYTISSLWTSKLCKAYVTFLSTLPLVTTPGKPKKGEAVRVNDRYQVDDPHFAQQLWSSTALKDLVTHTSIGDNVLTDEERRVLWGGEVLGLNSNIRIYRYSKGQFFDQHYDESNAVPFPSPTGSTVPARTTWTLLLYLTSSSTGCYGGETIFYPEAAGRKDAAPAPIVTELEVGMALLHRHGRECLLHEGREVTAGEKWVIRSDLCVKR